MPPNGPASESPMEGYSESDSGSDASEGFDYGNDNYSLSSYKYGAKTGLCCKPILTAKCFCHCCYIAQLILYILIFPLWCKYLVTAPMQVDYWGENFPSFPLIRPIEKMDLAAQSNATPQIVISPIPAFGNNCDFSCSKSFNGGEQTDEMNFPLRIAINTGENQKTVGTLFPVVLTSSDFKHWMVAADRRDSSPRPFWRITKTGVGRGYSMTSPSCTKPPSTSFGLRSTYVLVCITWRVTSLTTLRDAGPLNTSDLVNVCDSIGGVCGWPCGSAISSAVLPSCTRDGKVNVHTLIRDYFPHSRFQGNATLQGCESNNPFERCVNSQEPISRWKCHHCVSDVVSTDDDEVGAGDEGDSGFGVPDLPGISGTPAYPGSLPPLRRLRQLASRVKYADEEDTRLVYRSLPRMRVKLDLAEVPSPHAYFLTAPTLAGPWVKLYETPDPLDPDSPDPPIPYSSLKKQKSAAAEGEDVKQAPEIAHTMNNVDQNELEVRPESCYGRRGPLYVVVCAMNASQYDVNPGGAHKVESIFEKPKFMEFKRGQAVASPPFNDRCVAVSGRCGYACMPSASDIPYCQPDGYINMTHLVGDIEAPSNKTAAVWTFVYVLLFGFCYKVVMLCPGIFRPYEHYLHYTPELSQQVRYVVACTPSITSDDNKTTVMRSLIGLVSAMPADIKCYYHVVLLDENHRIELKKCWRKMLDIVNAIPFDSNDSFQDNVTDFFGVWCAETKKLNLQQIGSRVRELEVGVMDRISGKSTLRLMHQEFGWGTKGPLRKLEIAIAEFEKDLSDDNTWTREAINFDDIEIWGPPVKAASPFRMHYVARAKPNEDERANKVQHVAPGMWYYNVPPDADIHDWLELRRDAKEMIYGMVEDDWDNHKVPLRTSRGKSGGLNFVDNYMCVVAERPEYIYDSLQDNQPYLYSICSARHQYQPDFMVSTIPYFFTRRGVLNQQVAYTQCPLHYYGSEDKTDYLDTNLASWFRLTCMIRNCCGGVFSHGTNCTWMVKHFDYQAIWEAQKGRVRKKQTWKHDQEIVERRTFSESCMADDTAASLKAVMAGKHSQFVNRKLVYGMAKADLGALASRQRWTQGAVAIILQLATSCGRGVWMLAAMTVFVIAFIASLVRLVTFQVDKFLVVRSGLATQEHVDMLLGPIDRAVDTLLANILRRHLLGDGVRDTEIYSRMFREVFMWVVMLVAWTTLLWGLTCFCKAFRRRWCTFPDQMRWCARLLVAIETLSSFLWFWTAFFWIGFNVCMVLSESHFHFQYSGMMFFMVTANVLSIGMAFSNSARYSLAQAMDANEVASISIDNFWRANQLFYMMAPIQLYSVLKGVREFLRYRCYGIDTSWQQEVDNEVTVKIVKFWSLFLVVGPAPLWVYYYKASQRVRESWAACIVLTLIALDVLHPCVYLWLRDGAELEMTDDLARQISWRKAISTPSWWRRTLRRVVLNSFLAGFLKYVGPAYFVLLPLTCLYTTYFGVNAAFMLVMPM